MARFTLIAPSRERLQELLESYPAATVTKTSMAGQPTGATANITIDDGDALDFMGRAADLGIQARSL